MWLLIYIIDIFLFALVALSVAYLLFFAIASTRYQRIETGITRKRSRFLIIVTATPADTRIESTIQSLLKQDYERKDYDIIVVGDNLTPLQCIKLAQYPITLLRTHLEQGTKSQAQLHAMRNIQSMKLYDQVVLIDPDEMVTNNFLTELNKFMQSGSHFVQLHRKPQNTKSSASILSATMEEINNSIFRKGHVACGMSSALIGSAMVLDFNWFKNNVTNIDPQDEEKSLETILLRQNIFIDYLDDVCVYVRPVNKEVDILKQRRRWMQTKFTTLIKNTLRLLPALLHWNISLADKFYQWIMIPRILMMSIIIIMSIVLPFIYFSLVVKWWILLLVVTFAFALATPDYLVDKQWRKSFINVPVLLFGSIYNTLTTSIFTNIFKKKAKHS